MELVMALGSGWVIGLILGMVTGMFASLFLVKDSGNLWLWESRKAEALEKELAQVKAKLREQHLALDWDLQ
jgi:hypothetical protein